MGIAYGFDSETGEYAGEVYAQESPLEPGNILVPANATMSAPPAHVDGKRRIFADGAWQYQEIPIEPEPPAPTPEELEAARAKAAEYAIQKMMDDDARTRGYDNIQSASSYAALPVGEPFQDEGAAYLLWRAKCWSKCYAVQADVKAGIRPEPTIDELIAEMPALVLP